MYILFTGIKYAGGDVWAAANAMKGDKEKCIAAGMDDYISKPVEKKRLEEVLARWLGPAVVS
jgi:CheY-like chemotaxis protein